MTQATIELRGIGFVEIETDANEITIVDQLMSDGARLNARTKKVLKNKKSTKAALETRPYFSLKEVEKDVFILEKY